jgi:putative zinc finger/helix-turn-helix YgiT family protein
MPYLAGKCPNCRERRVTQVTERYDTTVEHDGRAYDISIPDLTLLKCEACGNRVLPGDADDRVSDAVRVAAGLLSPVEIRGKRLGLNLTPAEVADALGVSEEIFGQWESGSLIPSRQSDRMLRAFFAVPELRRYLSGPGARTAPTPGATPEPPLRHLDI